MDNFLQQMLASTHEATGEERTIEEVRYQDGATWCRADDPANQMIGRGSPVVARRTIRQRRMRQTYPDGHTVEGWETQK